MKQSSFVTISDRDELHARKNSLLLPVLNVS